MIRVLIADDHMIVREGMKLIVSETSDIVIAAHPFPPPSSWLTGG